MRTRLALLLVAVFTLAVSPARAAELFMFEEPGCIWCQRWHAEIGAGYDKSEEGAVAPLHRLDIRRGAPPGVRLERPVTMTPTFVLVADGSEVGRIVGYPGAHFFYPMLAELLKKLAPPQDRPQLPAQKDVRKQEATTIR